jgi:hypothetical protein
LGTGSTASGKRHVSHLAIETTSAGQRFTVMPTKHERPEQLPDKDDDARTREAKRVMEDYAAGMREMLEKLRRLFN